MAKVPKPLTRIFQQEWIPIFKQWYACLSEKDKMILACRAKGATNTKTAELLGVEEQTVKNRIVIIRKSFNATFYN